MYVKIIVDGCLLVGDIKLLLFAEIPVYHYAKNLSINTRHARAYRIILGVPTNLGGEPRIRRSDDFEAIIFGQ